METLRQSKPKARKEHKCDFCDGTIEVSVVYNNTVHAYEGELYMWKTHKNCQDIAEKLDMYTICDGEGVSGDDFNCMIRDAYHDLMLGTEIFRGKDWKNPPFKVMLDHVCNHHLKID